MEPNDNSNLCDVQPEFTHAELQRMFGGLAGHWFRFRFRGNPALFTERVWSVACGEKGVYFKTDTREVNIRALVFFEPYKFSPPRFDGAQEIPSYDYLPDSLK